jgi:hypothetical protein
MEQKMKLSWISWLLITRSPGTISPKPIVLRLMKQKYELSRKSQPSHSENRTAPKQMYLQEQTHYVA